MPSNAPCFASGKLRGMTSPAQVGSRPPENGIAVAGLILGILGIVLFWLPLIGMLVALIGLVLGALGMGKARRTGGKHFGLAVTGLVTGIVGFIVGLGVLAAVAVPAFLDYQHKTRPPQSTVALHKLERSIKTYWNTFARLPPDTSVMPGPAGSGCGGKNRGKIPVSIPAEWNADPGWREINAAEEFWIDEPSFYSYKWTRTSDMAGFAEAIGDLDCDRDLSTTRMEIEVVDGTVRSTYRDPTPD